MSLVLVVFIAGGVTIAAAGPGSATSPITRAQADVFAQAVELRASDLPGASALKGAIFGSEAVQYEALKCGLQGRPGIVPVGGGEIVAGQQPRAGRLHRGGCTQRLLR